MLCHFELKIANFCNIPFDNVEKLLGLGLKLKNISCVRIHSIIMAENISHV